MSRRLLGLSFIAFTVLVAVSSFADDNAADEYSQTGKVLAVVSKHGHFYQIATEGNICLLMCTKVRSFQLGEPECKIGDKPIVVDDTVHFRIDGDWAYLPPISGDMEEKLRILTTELKITPALPAVPSANDKSLPAPNEGAVVIGTGMHVKGQHGVGWSTPPPSRIAVAANTTASATTPVMATAPVVAIPVTGGAPVVVIPVAPTTGGVVTGITVTGGAPITAIPTAPVMGVPLGGAPAAGGGMMMGGGGAPQWVHVLRIQTAGKIYQLEGSGKPFTLANKAIALGDTLSIRVDKKHAYLSRDGQSSDTDHEFKILGTTEIGAAPASKPN